MCIEHWRRVPKVHRDAILGAYRAYSRLRAIQTLSRRPVPTAPILAAAERIRTAQAAGLAAVEEKLVKRALKASAGQQGLDL